MAARLQRLLRGRSSLGADLLAEVEEVLLAADLGVRTADELLEAARGAEKPEHVSARLQERALEMLRATPEPPSEPTARHPCSRNHVTQQGVGRRPPDRLSGNRRGLVQGGWSGLGYLLVLWGS